MGETTNLSPFLGSFMTVVFIFSTIYTLAFYYYQGTGEAFTADDTVTFPSIIESILEALSWISPFALLKLLLLNLMSGTPEIYEALNLLVLRPVGWIMTLFTGNYILSKVPTISGET